VLRLETQNCAKNAWFLSDGFFTNTILLHLTLGRIDQIDTSPLENRIEIYYPVVSEVEYTQMQTNELSIMTSL